MIFACFASSSPTPDEPDGEPTKKLPRFGRLCVIKERSLSGTEEHHRKLNNYLHLAAGPGLLLLGLEGDEQFFHVYSGARHVAEPTSANGAKQRVQVTCIYPDEPTQEIVRIGIGYFVSQWNMRTAIALGGG